MKIADLIDAQMQETNSKFVDLSTVPVKKARFVLKSAVKRSPENGLIIFSSNLNFDLWLRQVRSKSPPLK